MEQSTDDKNVVLVTGTNSGLGFATCCRLIDEFFARRPASQSLTLIFTTRSLQKSSETHTLLQAHLSQSATRFGTNDTRVTLHPERVDLGNLHSVRALAKRLLECPSVPAIDTCIWNAGVSGFKGIDFWKVIWTTLINPLESMTWPTAIIGQAGLTQPKQLRDADDNEKEEEPKLGTVFCTNVFGHYILAHYLMPLLTVRPQTAASRVVWISSIEATLPDFDVEDIQALKTPRAYQSSKYLTDTLALTSDLPNTKPWADKYFAASPSSATALAPRYAEKSNGGRVAQSKPKMYTCHPGICGTSIVPLNFILNFLMYCFFFIIRSLGSPWHVVSAYKGAAAPVWLALASQAKIGEKEEPYRSNGGGAVKWGSSTDRLGRESVVCTELDGWGFGGVVVADGAHQLPRGDRERRRRKIARDLTADAKVGFVERGRACWDQMEQLREEWEMLLAEDASMD